MDKLIKIHNGVVTTLYADDLPELGKQTVARASAVEYGITPGVEGWEVQLSDDPRNSKHRGLLVVNSDTAVPKSLALSWSKIGRYAGFKSRAEALATEVEFIQNAILQGKEPQACPSPV